MGAFEANFDGLVGPTHGYAGLSYGNVASTASQGAASSPKKAALEGLAKMKALSELGLVQGVLPPQERPDVRALRKLGFSGTDAQVIERAAREDRVLLALCSSASSMWTANAATVAPSADASDGRVHFTVANLQDRPHRALEHAQTARTLRAVFRDPATFVVHEALAMGQGFADEGAANHTRLCTSQGEPGLHLFVYGRRGIGSDVSPTRFPARQTLEASRAVARLNGVEERAVFVQQNPAVIDQGVFHNDVIAVGHETKLFFHQEAFADRDGTLTTLRERFPSLVPIEVRSSDVSVEDAVRSYLFNSQLVTIDGRHVLISPEECREVPSVARVLEKLVADAVIAEVKLFDLRQSMRNGGGPACLRLRVPLTDTELEQVNPACLVDEHQYERLVAWVDKHYRDRLEPSDLADPKLLDESRRALDALTEILGVGSIYPFQRG